MVLTIVEHETGEVDEVSFEALTLARDVAEQEEESLDAITFGPEGEGVADDVATHGVDAVHVVEELDSYAPEAWAESVAQCSDALDASAVVAPGTDRGSEVLAHVAAKTDESMAATCTEVTVGDAYEITRQRWGGTLIEHAELHADTKLLTNAVNEISVGEADAPGDATVESFSPDLDDEDFRVELEAVETDDSEGVPLGEARVVVSGGRGVGSADGFDKLESLSEHIPKSAVGSSRAAVNEGWRPHDDQVGQTGNKISPEIYIPCGISGAVQHMVGCKGAENILAVNTDPEAAIIQKADWAVIADLHEVVPAVEEELEARGH
jgi:electron transfer flavoprotein alpha subunit